MKQIANCPCCDLSHFSLFLASFCSKQFIIASDISEIVNTYPPGGAVTKLYLQIQKKWHRFSVSGPSQVVDRILLFESQCM